MKPSDFLATENAALEAARDDVEYRAALCAYLGRLGRSESLLEAVDALQSWAASLLLHERLELKEKVTYSSHLLSVLPPEARHPGENFPVFAAQVCEAWEGRVRRLTGGVKILRALNRLVDGLDYRPGSGRPPGDAAADLYCLGGLPELAPEPEEGV